MAEEKFTRCPGCRTVFRVTPAQLALREGQVRCGHCRTVFDGTANLIRLSTGSTPPAQDESTGPLTVTLRSAAALEPMTASPATATVRPTPPPEEAPAPSHVDYDKRFAWDRPKARSRGAALLYATGIVVLAGLLLGQLAWHYRDLLAAHWPSARPLLTRMCAIGGCEIRPLRDVAWLSIDASDLQADPAHKGLLILSATIRNRAPYAVAHPHLELTLTEGQDTVVVRRALTPAEYTGGSVDAARGIPGNGEVAVKLFVDASATVQSGYRVYLFYP
ncbi:MAG TPA: zinc-ribbon and DUF3426 domain-containing protein [Casimicrobiaceae bacterium]|nr:zinc-ribbon and DUF3426 domain-containing protein [Casimicrobiaceae bacterium]